MTSTLRHRLIAAALAVVPGLLAVHLTPIATAQSDDGLATFFLGRLKYSDNDGNDCSQVGLALTQLVSRAATIRVREERKLRLSDPAIFDTPFLFMNGHYDFVFDDTEMETLRTYLDHGGFILVSGCCTNPAFPAAMRREFGRIFPGQSVEVIPYSHMIYRSFYRIDKVPCLHENRDIHLEGLFHEGRLVAVLCEDGLCCSFSMDNRCNLGKGVAPQHGQMLALNIAVYALTH